MSEPAGALESWWDAMSSTLTGRAIGPVVGRAYARKRFGITWLLLRTAGVARAGAVRADERVRGAPCAPLLADLCGGRARGRRGRHATTDRRAAVTAALRHRVRRADGGCRAGVASAW